MTAPWNVPAAANLERSRQMRLWSLAGSAESGSVGRGDGGSRLDKRDRIASPEPGTVALKRLLLTLLFCVLPHR